MTQPMNDAEVHRFLSRLPAATAVVATIASDGSPHVAPVWFALDDDGLVVFNTGETTVKGRNLRRDPRISVCIDDEQPPFSFVSIRGRAELVDDLDRVRQWATVIGGRYMGEENAEALGARNGVPGELLVRVHPERISALADLAE